MTFACKFCWLAKIIVLCLCYRTRELHFTLFIIFALLSHCCDVLLTKNLLQILLRHNFVLIATQGAFVLAKQTPS